MKCLYVDDQASLGWGDVVRFFLKNKGINTEVINTVDEAKRAIADYKYDLILLDIRIEDNDYAQTLTSEFSSYKIVNEFIRRHPLDCKNFTTPVFLFTASNKMRHLDGFIEAGVDGYYIKESPEFFDSSDAKGQYDSFSRNIDESIKQSRNKWNVISIIKKISEESKMKSNETEKMIDKILFSYSLLFHSSRRFENDLFGASIYSPFIVLFSVFEELIKRQFIDDWDSDYEKMNNGIYRFKNNQVLIDNQLEKDAFGQIQGSITSYITYNRFNKVYVAKKETFTENNDPTFNRLQKRLDLNFMAWGYFLLVEKFDVQKIKNTFIKVRDYRNKCDFIHPNLKDLYSESVLKEKNKKSEVFENYQIVLDLVFHITSN